MLLVLVLQFAYILHATDPIFVNVTALIAVRNEALYIARCCEHLARQGVTFVIIDNDSTDDTCSIARTFRGRGLVDIVGYPYPGYYDWTGLLRRKEQIAQQLDSDWFMHLDADEMPEPPARDGALIEELARADADGFNAVSFDEFVFGPISEADHHEGGDYVADMRHYYFFQPHSAHLVRAWRRHESIDLASSGGHHAIFPGRAIYPHNFVLRHYIALSMDHLRRKYSSERVYSPEELAKGWHRVRSQLKDLPLRAPPIEDLFDIRTDQGWNRSSPQIRHLFFPPI